MPRRSNIKTESKEIQWFEQDDIDKFVTACGTKFNNGRIKYKYGYILAANLYLGLRGGELLALQWKDIDLEAGTIYVSKTLIEARDVSGKTTFSVQESTKRDKNRYVPVNSKAKD
jgi:integrase